MTTVHSLTRQLSEIIQRTVSGVAESGTTTTLVDGDRTERADHFTDGTIWITNGSYDGISKKVTAYAQATGTFTFAAFAGAIIAGTTYYAAPKDFPRHVLIRSIDQALREIGTMPAVNTSLSVTADTEAYALPSGVRGITLVEVAQNSSEPYEWRVYQDVEEVDGYLRFENPPVTAGRTIRLHYNARHDAVSDDDDTVDDALHDELVVWAAAVYALRWKKLTYEGDFDGYYVDLLNEALLNKERWMGEYGVRKKNRAARTSGY